MLNEYLESLHKQYHSKIVDCNIGEYIEKGTMHQLPVIIQYYGLCKHFQSLPNEIELKTLDIALNSEEDIASAMALLSTMSTDSIFTDIFAYSAFMSIVAKDYTTPMGMLRPFNTIDLSKGIFSILFISGASNFPFSDKVSKMIASSLTYYSIDIPPKQLCIKEILIHLDNVSLSEKSKNSHSNETQNVHEALQKEIQDIIAICEKG